MLGVFASLGASVLFGVVFYLSGTVNASGDALFGWRALAVPLLYAPLLARAGARQSVGEFWTALTRRWWVPVFFIVIAAMMGIGAWLFVWAPRNGQGLDSSLGFLLLPITIVLASRIVLKSHVSRVQWIVVALAGIAVGVKIIATQQFGWVTVAVFTVFTIYFIARTHFNLSTLTAFGFESVLVLPVALYLIVTDPTWHTELGTLVLIGVFAAVAMTGYVGASTLLPLPLFGLLSYVEPILLVIASLMLGERMAPADSVVYGILAVALTLLAFAGFSDSRRLPRIRGRR